MRAMVVKVGPEIEQLVFEICRRPEQRLIQILASQGADCFPRIAELRARDSITRKQQTAPARKKE